MRQSFGFHAIGGGLSSGSSSGSKSLGGGFLGGRVGGAAAGAANRQQPKVNFGGSSAPMKQQQQAKLKRGEPGAGPSSALATKRTPTRNGPPAMALKTNSGNTPNKPKIGQMQQRQFGGPMNKGAQNSAASRPNPMPVESMSSHLNLDNEAMEVNERMLSVLLDEDLPSLKELGHKIAAGQWNGSGEQMGELLELVAQLGAKREQWRTRQEQLGRARDCWQSAQDAYGQWVAQEIEGTSELSQRVNGLLRRLEAGENGIKSSPQQPPVVQEKPKPIMVDKGVQAIPERTILTSPTHIRRAEMPTSPMLRSTSKQRQRPVLHLASSSMNNVSTAARSLDTLFSTAEMSASKENCG